MTAPIEGQLQGILHIPDERQDGRLRDPAAPLRPVKGDILVPRQLIRDFRLRPGVMLTGLPKGRHMTRIHTVEGKPPADYAAVLTLSDRTALDPEPMLKLEHNPAEPTTRIIDILAPIGFGQRGLIVA